MHEHEPVLLAEVIEFLHLQAGNNVVDATFGQGGHSRAIRERIGTTGKLLVLDRDPLAIDRARSLGSNVVAKVGNFRELASHVRYGLPHLPVHAVLFDCGISSTQLSDPTLGLSFAVEAPLTMRLDRDNNMTAATILNHWSERDIAETLKNYGEEPFARRIARAIVAARPLNTTTELAAIVARAVPRRSKIHPATRTFQAIRIAVNEELDSLSEGVSAALTLITKGGRVAVISFHSLEDRIVKVLFKEASRVCHCPEGLRCTCTRQANFRLLTKKPIVPTAREISANPRSRSAKLRVIEKLI